MRVANNVPKLGKTRVVGHIGEVGKVCYVYHTTNPHDLANLTDITHPAHIDD